MKTQIDKLREIYERNHRFPADWTRYFSLDPGTAKAAGLSGVVPPPEEFGQRLIVEWELDARRMPPSALAPAVGHMMAGMVYEAFIIDPKAGAQVTMGAERTTEEQYANAFAANNIVCEQTGSHFQFGSDEPMSRANEVREWMYPVQQGGPRLLVVIERCPTMCREFLLYKRKLYFGRKNDARNVSEQASRGNDDTMHALEYLVAWNPVYVQARKVVQSDPLYEDWKRRRGNRNARSRGVNLGPPVPA